MDTPPPPSPPSSKLARAGEAAVQVQLIRTTANIEHGGEGEGHRQVNATRVFANFFRGLWVCHLARGSTPISQAARDKRRSRREEG